MYIILTANEDLVELARKNGDQYLKISADSAESYSFEKSYQKESIDGVISEFLTTLGIQAHLKGFDYIKYIIKKALKQPGFEDLAVTRIIYPNCAEALGTTSTRVERAIRHAIERSFSIKRNTANYIAVFGNLEKHPTNDHFIKTIVLYFKERIL